MNILDNEMVKRINVIYEILIRDFKCVWGHGTQHALCDHTCHCLCKPKPVPKRAEEPRIPATPVCDKYNPTMGFSLWCGNCGHSEDKHQPQRDERCDGECGKECDTCWPTDKKDEVEEKIKAISLAAFQRQNLGGPDTWERWLRELVQLARGNK